MNETKGKTRRDFLATAGTGLVAAGVASQVAEAQDPKPSEPPSPIRFTPMEAKTERDEPPPPLALPPDQRVGFAIVGLGRLALEEIMPAFAQSRLARPVALVSGDPAKAEKVARSYGIKPQGLYDYQTYDRIRDNPEVEAVYIVLPNSMHLEFTVRAARAGKHVFCEKPMATSSRECGEMIEACKSANKTLMIAYRCQYEPYNLAMTRLVRSKEFGPARQIELANFQNMGDPSQWRFKKSLAGGGSLPDIGIYGLNAARFLTGEEPVEVFARIQTDRSDPRFKEVEDNVAFTLKFPSGVIATMQSGYSAHETRRYRVMCESGWAELDPAFSYQGLRMRVGRAAGKVEFLEERKLGEKNQFALELDHMAHCVRSGKKPRTPGEEGMQDHRLMEAIYESAASDKLVKLARVEGLDVTRGQPMDA